MDKFHLTISLSHAWRRYLITAFNYLYLYCQEPFAMISKAIIAPSISRRVLSQHNDEKNEQAEIRENLST